MKKLNFQVKNQSKNDQITVSHTVIIEVLEIRVALLIKQRIQKMILLKRI